MNQTELLSVGYVIGAAGFSVKKMMKDLNSPLPVFVTFVPERVEFERPVPVVCIIKNLNNESISLENIKINILKQRELVFSTKVHEKSTTIRTDYWYKLFFVEVPSGINGNIEIETKIEVNVLGKNNLIKNDSYRFSSHDPVKIFLGREKLPRLGGYYFGDIFNHDYFSIFEDSDGLPLEVKTDFEKAKGNDFTAASNNSFDCLTNDNNNGSASEKDWHSFLKKVQEINENSEFVLLPGDYINCTNNKGKHVPVIILNNQKYFERSANGKFGLIPKNVNTSIKKLKSCLAPDTISIASKTARKPSIISGLFRKKGSWKLKDLILADTTGIHIEISKLYEQSKNERTKWINQLLGGSRKALMSGSGFYSGEKSRTRFKRSVLSSKKREFTKYSRLGVLCEKGLTQGNLVDCIKKGKTLITNGPLLHFHVSNENEDLAYIGDTISGEELTVNFRLASTPEFGQLKKLCLYLGDLSTKKEEMIYKIFFDKNNYKLKGAINFEVHDNTCYIRGELFSGHGNDSFYCFTNPIWVTKKSD